MFGQNACMMRSPKTYFDECGGTVGEQRRAQLAAFALILALANSLFKS